MAFKHRRKSFENTCPSLLKTNIKERYCERRYKEYLMDPDEDEQDKDEEEYSGDLDHILDDEDSDKEFQILQSSKLSMVSKIKSHALNILNNNRFLLSRQEIMSIPLYKNFVNKGIAEICEEEKEESSPSPKASALPCQVFYPEITDAPDCLKLKNKRRRMKRKLRRLKVIDCLSDTNA
ncbi:unnamed protein product [Moneuplotes crassus]|uniref:Uncharacterized protein n=1 Tax=Euplotes crassus TaxID=5936 RepID=A0AAD2D2Q1_EUPCR|nr:unnamed protein product [Moneuplotes crassus]